ncbi:P-type ATPase [Elasticomyces elasticus]|nr:P-type ATPase [Elasticomyces elasticus]
MVTKRVWIPAKGTYSVGSLSDPFNPTLGSLSYDKRPPCEVDLAEAEKQQEGIPYEELIENNKHLEEFLNVASLANLTEVLPTDEGAWNVRGDPTEIAIQIFASRFDWNRNKFTKGENPMWCQVAEFSFDSDVKKMSMVFEKRDSKQQTVFTKGAVERIVGSCSLVHWETGSEITGMTEERRERILDNMEALASQGLRVLAFASKECSGLTAESDHDSQRADVESDLVFRGLIGLYDPPRTARAIAVQVGILPPNVGAIPRDVAESMVMTAGQFDKLSDGQIDALPVLPLVIARCAPNTKVRMIEALHRRKCFAAMTGDGVNDSPSLKRADVGIAMGQGGSDVAKDASDIILTDDNFASILNAVEEGRRMFDNIQKFVLHLLAENIAQACTLLIGLVFKDASGFSVFPLSPVEILWVIMITSGMPDMGLGVEIAAPDIMMRSPQPLKKGIFTLEILVDMLAHGLWMACLCLAAFVLVLFGFGDGTIGEVCNESYSQGCDIVFRARATTFLCLTWFALLLAWGMVDMRRSFFRMQPQSKKYFTQWMYDVWRNQFLFWAIIAGFITVFPVLYIPVINHVVFKHEGISWEWGIVLINAILFFAGVEAWKWAKRIIRRRKAKKNAGNEMTAESRVFGMNANRLDA